MVVLECGICNRN